jgi:hypothetical protein
MPTLVSDVLAFRQQSLLEQQEQRQQELRELHHPIRSPFHGLDQLTMNPNAEHHPINEEAVHQRTDVSYHLHATHGNVECSQGKNVLHKLPSDVARLAISFL